MASSERVTKNLLEKLLRSQERRAERERKMSFAKKLRVVDRLMADGEPKFEEAGES